MKKIKVGIVGSIKKVEIANLIKAKGVVVNEIANSGFIPVILPITKNENIIEKLVQNMDILVLQEGQTISPFLYNENPKIKNQYYLFERDFSEFMYLEMAIKYNKKILGINRGAQLINVFFGGSLYQNLERDIINANYHIGIEGNPETYHKIEISENSKLFEIIKMKELIVKSNHYQGIKNLGKNLKIVAKSEDGVIEAFEGNNILGIQFSLGSMEEEYAKQIFEYFKECKGNECE